MLEFELTKVATKDEQVKIGQVRHDGDGTFVLVVRDDNKAGGVNGIVLQEPDEFKSLGDETPYSNYSYDGDISRDIASEFPYVAKAKLQVEI